ncbi:MAG: HEPN domain-containing protein [Chitinispirillaceae bacterium]|nr:HEPN domain-containing protein [Chitinispirillaceae bacterium]
MTDQDYRNIIAHDWMEKSESALNAAEILLREHMLVACVNRLYYAAFYAVSAALAKAGREYGRHTAVRAALHRDYVKTALIPFDFGKTYDRLFDDRQEGDYAPKTSFKEEEIERLLEETRGFLDCFKRLITEE